MVERTERDAVFVKITSQSACGSCHARQACGLSESQDKIVTVVTPEASSYAPGDAVMVGIRRRAGGIAVFFAYILALGVLLVLLIVGIKAMGWNEGVSALVALSGVAIYYCVLWLYRHKMEAKIQIKITKI